MTTPNTSHVLRIYAPSRLLSSIVGLIEQWFVGNWRNQAVTLKFRLLSIKFTSEHSSLKRSQGSNYPWKSERSSVASYTLGVEGQKILPYLPGDYDE